MGALWEERMKGKSEYRFSLTCVLGGTTLGMPSLPLIVHISFHLDTCCTFLPYYWDSWVSNGFSVTSHVI